MSRLSDTRLYVVIATDDSGVERLVRASNKARAARLAVTARIATQADLERLLKAGVTPEFSTPERQAPRRPPRAQQRRA
jgi:hypothetical protein